ncbi:site-specific integrase [uncultured Maricaulis sp.]|uniref:tyrosine-type recombinase/integrase n=1 Tax=uncultured Maricaulis sp. TaxID=174710 RepID=UPI0025E3678C|nr:site-specific integrase [uncultured Maricaulis sp.]
MPQPDDTKLTKRFCEQIQVDSRKEFPDHLERGLRLRVTPKGIKSWSFLYYRPGDGSRARLSFGTFPAISLDEARRRTREARAKLDHGDDPGAARHAREIVETFNQLADLYLERHARPNKRTSETDERLLRRDIRPVIGHLPVERITRSDVHATLDKVAARGAPVQTERVYETMRGVFRWGLAEDYIHNDPTLGMKRRFKRAPRDRVLADVELASILKNLDKTPLDRRTILALKLALATGQRIGEVCGAQITEFDLLRDLWTIPGMRAKNSLTHEVPLGSFAKAIIEEAMTATAGATFLFASQPRNRIKHGDVEQPLLASSATKGFGRCREIMGLKGEPVRPHDFRRTFATFMQKSAVPEAVVARLLNHRSDTARSVTSAVYMKHKFVAEKRDAMALWNQHLLGLCAPGIELGAVIPISGIKES